jgi:hypothetical protein
LVEPVSSWKAGVMSTASARAFAEQVPAAEERTAAAREKKAEAAVA